MVRSQLVLACLALTAVAAVQARLMHEGEHSSLVVFPSPSSPLVTCTLLLRQCSGKHIILLQ
jgi:hypothetical protein